MKLKLEWIGGGQLTWMRDVQVDRNETSTYGKSPKGLSKPWWRNFIQQAAAAGYITHTVKTAKFGNSNGVYASLSPSDESIRAIEKGAPIMLPALLKIHKIHCLQFVQTTIKMMMICIILQESEKGKVAIYYHLLRSSLSQRKTGSRLKTKKTISFWEHFHLHPKTCYGMLKTSLGCHTIHHLIQISYGLMSSLAKIAQQNS